LGFYGYPRPMFIIVPVSTNKPQEVR